MSYPYQSPDGPGGGVSSGFEKPTAPPPLPPPVAALPGVPPAAGFHRPDVPPTGYHRPDLPPTGFPPPGPGPVAYPPAAYQQPVHGGPSPAAAPGQPVTGYTGTPTGYAGAQTGYPGAQTGYPGTQTGYPGTQTGYPGAQTGYTDPQAGYAGAQTGYAGAQPASGPPGATIAELIVSAVLVLTCVLAPLGIASLVLSAMALSRAGRDPESAARLTRIGWFTMAGVAVLGVVVFLVVVLVAANS